MAKIQIPKIKSLQVYHRDLVRIVAETSWLPHQRTVRAFRTHVFPTARQRKQHLLFSFIKRGNTKIGMYDDNTTPRWALFWAHGIRATYHPGKWTFAHVWPGADDITTYTHLANLAMVPECLMNLTDKEGPLTEFLQWHAWDIYDWKPKSAKEPRKPEGYDKVRWNYLDYVANPKDLVSERINGLNNQRIRILRPVMKRLGMLA